METKVWIIARQDFINGLQLEVVDNRPRLSGDDAIDFEMGHIAVYEANVNGGDSVPLKTL